MINAVEIGLQIIIIIIIVLLLLLLLLLVIEAHLNFLDFSAGVFRPRLKSHLGDQAVLRPTIDRALRVTISVTLPMKYPSD